MKAETFTEENALNRTARMRAKMTLLPGYASKTTKSIVEEIDRKV